MATQGFGLQHPTQCAQPLAPKTWRSGTMQPSLLL
jgi:hypothetical protein